MDREKAAKELQDYAENSWGELNEAFELAIEALQEQERINWTKPLADSTLMRMTKSELIEYVRMCEKNVENAMWRVDQQAKNVEKLLKESERKKGHWKADGIAMVCDQCGKKLVVEQGDADMNYCPHCGADMRGEEE